MLACRTVSIVCLMSALSSSAQRAPVRGIQESSVSPSGPEIFASHCTSCHGADGRGGGGGPNIASSREVRELADPELLHVVRDGISGQGMPPFASMGEQQIKTVVRYLRTLQGRDSDTARFSGNAAAGKMLFFGKARCSDCHM